ncbi:hypothetical protein [Flexivirga alba]|uniref:Fe/B12 periplasmic-binding domain-containing protein n=1 Tax=Flexivirga alba TaxID=702742 RepID=A0ABW2AFE6_9MICO
MIASVAGFWSSFFQPVGATSENDESPLLMLPFSVDVLGVGVAAAVTVVGIDTWLLGVGDAVPPLEPEHAVRPASSAPAVATVSQRVDIEVVMALDPR